MSYEGYYKAYYNQAGAISSYEPQPDGGLIIHNVPIMAAGAWDDMRGTHTVFSPEVLQRCAAQWNDYAVWTRHSGGTPRPVTEKIGAVLNPHYSPEMDAVMADILLHGKTETSRQAIALVQLARDAGGITDVSAETIVDLSSNGQVLDVVFTGLALVEDGACEVCRLPAFSLQEDISMAEEEVKETVEVKEETPEATAEEVAAETLEGLLGRFVSQLIPEAGDLIKSVQASEGEAKAFALGRLAGCMEAYGLPEAPKEEAEAPAEETAEEQDDDEKEAEMSAPDNAQFERPQGLKGSLGAETVTETRQTVTYYGRDLRTALY